MRKILCLLLCYWLIFALTACNSTRNEVNSKSASPGESFESTYSLVPMESGEGSPSDIPASGSEPVEVTEQPSASLTESTTGPITRPTATPTQSTPAETGNDHTEDDGMISIKIAVGNTTFTAKLYDNKTTRALVAQFPITIQMNELNGQEKYYNLSKNLPAASTDRPPTIHTGDIMCWSGNSLVLFYRTYSNSFGGYVPLGKVDNPSNLASALGSGNVQVTWSLAD
jgi:hypothetical protein